ncbi:MAG: hypothetical protein F6K11_32465, partial [Leptolyngbya sp. SIO3F4]|nr:hypothetical protein [Leptolyngbya sp. SIO3F4]
MTQFLSIINHTNHIWLPIIVAFVALKWLFYQSFRQRWGKRIRRCTVLGVIVYCLMFLVLWSQQPHLLYKPTHELQTTPESHNLHYEEVWVPSGPQLLEHLHSWWLPQPNNRIGTLIYFHGAGL